MIFLLSSLLRIQMIYVISALVGHFLKVASRSADNAATVRWARGGAVFLSDPKDVQCPSD